MVVAIIMLVESFHNLGVSVDSNLIAVSDALCQGIPGEFVHLVVVEFPIRSGFQFLDPVSHKF